ncbi:MAG: zinc-binding dehydrogenase, partial [Victivallaceae bacterium]
MRRAVVATRQGIKIKAMPSPELLPGTVRIKTAVSLISPGTEGKTVRGGVKEEFIMGYVAGGIVTELGEGVTGFEIGQRVTGTKWGMACHATEDVIPQNCLCPIPDALSFEAAVLAGLAGTGLYGVRQAQIEPGHYTVIAGGGLIGQFAAQFARINGTHVMLWDKLDSRLKIAMETGAEAVVNVDKQDAVAETMNFAKGRGIERGLLAMGGDMTSTFGTLLKCFVIAPDGKRIGRVSLPGLGPLTIPDSNALGGVEICPVAACGLGYRDPQWERGKEYPGGHIIWNMKRNLEEILIWMVK